MDTKLQIVAGPPTTNTTREAAEAGLRAHPQFPKNAAVELSEVEGRWVAAIAVTASEDLTKESAPPFGGGADGGGEGGPPTPDAASPDTDGPPSEDDAPSDDDKPKKEKGGEKGVEAQLHAVTEMLHTLMEALGLAPNPADSPVPGAEDPGAGPPGPPGAGDGGDSKNRVVHERALKPGEAQPGSTPIGAPAFASVSDDHPWKEVVASDTREFQLAEEIGDDEPMATIAKEIEQLAEGTGFRLTHLSPEAHNGKRIARARLER